MGSRPWKGALQRRLLRAQQRAEGDFSVVVQRGDHEWRGGVEVGSDGRGNRVIFVDDELVQLTLDTTIDGVPAAEWGIQR